MSEFPMVDERNSWEPGDPMPPFPQEAVTQAAETIREHAWTDAHGFRCKATMDYGGCIMEQKPGSDRWEALLASQSAGLEMLRLGAENEKIRQEMEGRCAYLTEHRDRLLAEVEEAKQNASHDEEEVADLLARRDALADALEKSVAIIRPLVDDDSNPLLALRRTEVLVEAETALRLVGRLPEGS